MKKLLDIPDDLLGLVTSNAKENRRSVVQEIIKMIEYCTSSKEVYLSYCGSVKHSQR